MPAATIFRSATVTASPAAIAGTATIAYYDNANGDLDARTVTPSGVVSPIRWINGDR